MQRAKNGTIKNKSNSRKILRWSFKKAGMLAPKSYPRKRKSKVKGRLTKGKPRRSRRRRRSRRERSPSQIF